MVSDRAAKSIVVGEGWSAVLMCALMAKRGDEVVWLGGSGTYVAPVVGSLSAQQAEAFCALLKELELEPGEIEAGSFVREYRQRAFFPVEWAVHGESETRREIWTELLCTAERRYIPYEEVRLGRNLDEIYEALISQTADQSNVTRIEGVPVAKVSESDQGLLVQAGNGQEWIVEKLYFTDRPRDLRKIQGISVEKQLRQFSTETVLQIAFTHEKPLRLDVKESFSCFLPREPRLAGKAKDGLSGREPRRVWGRFSENGKKSYWSIFLQAEEAEDNHEIGKRIRRMKQVLNKAFPLAEWLAQPSSEQNSADFMVNVKEETVRLEEDAVFIKGNLENYARLGQPRFVLLSDGFGLDSVVEQVLQHSLGGSKPAMPQKEPEVSL